MKNNKSILRKLLIQLLTERSVSGKTWSLVKDYLATYDPKLLVDLENTVMTINYSEQYEDGIEVWIQPTVNIEK
jgi:hypothetical protein